MGPIPCGFFCQWLRLLLRRKRGEAHILQSPAIAIRSRSHTVLTPNLPTTREAHVCVLLPMAQSLEDAVSTLRGALGVPIGAARSVQTPVGQVTILEELLAHVVEQRPDARERYAPFVLPTLMSPDEVWATAYDDGTKRRRFIKLFTGGKYDIMVVVRQEPNGDVLWNIINRDRKDMNNLRVGALEYAVGP